MIEGAAMRKVVYMLIGATSALVVALLVVPMGAGATQSVQPVTVTNPATNPVLVSGSVGVNGTVGVTGSVGVTGTVGLSSTGNVVKLDPNQSAVTSGDQTVIAIDDEGHSVGAGLGFVTSAIDTSNF